MARKRRRQNLVDRGRERALDRSPLRLLAALSAAVAARDVGAVYSLVTGAASVLPRRVREEALAIASLPRASLRAPIALWSFYHQTCQLRQESPADPRQLELFLRRSA